MVTVGLDVKRALQNVIEKLKDQKGRIFYSSKDLKSAIDYVVKMQCLERADELLLQLIYSEFFRKKGQLLECISIMRQVLTSINECDMLKCQLFPKMKSSSTSQLVIIITINLAASLLQMNLGFDCLTTLTRPVVPVIKQF